MTTLSASVLQYGRRQGSSKNITAHVQEEKTTPIKLPDLRHVTVLPKVEWLRIQDNLNHVNKQKESIMEASRERERLHLRSKEAVQFWSNTIAGERQKKLEAKKIREEAEEKERQQTDLEEAKYQQEKRKKAVEKAKTQQYYQTDRVKGFHSALLLTEVLKEREAQLELKQRRSDSNRNADRDVAAQLICQEQEALKQEQHSTEQRKLKNKAIAEAQKQQIKDRELIREQQKLDSKKEMDELLQLKQHHDWERRRLQQNLQEEKIIMKKAYMDHVVEQDTIRAIETQKEKMEEERRRLFNGAKEKMMKLRKEKEAEMFREVQRYKEAILEKLTAQKMEQISNEDELIAKAVAEQEAKLQKQQNERDQKKAAMLEAIASHRNAMKQEKEVKEKEEKRKAQDVLHAKSEADRIFQEKQQLKAHKIKEDCKALQDMHFQQMAERCAKEQLEKKHQMDIDKKNMDLTAEEEKQFQVYAQEVIGTAAKAKKNTYALQKAAREGIGGGLGPCVGGLRPSYLAHDETGVQMPSYTSSTTQNVKGLYEATDIQQSKKRLGFTA